MLYFSLVVPEMVCVYVCGRERVMTVIWTDDKQVCEVHTEVTKTVMHNGLWKERLLEHHKEQEGRRAKVTTDNT